MPTAHTVSTADGVILVADKGFLDLVRRPEREIIGASYRVLTHPDDLDKSAHMLNALVDRAPPYRLTKRYLRPDGSVVTALLFVTWFADPDRLVSTLFWNEAEHNVRPERLWEAARRMQHIHDVRRAAFGEELAHDPIGALLLTIYLAEAEGRIVGVDQLAHEASVPRSTALRWLKVLEQRDIIQADDDRRENVQFTQAGILSIERTLGSFYDPQ